MNDLTQLDRYREFGAFDFAVLGLRTFQLRHERRKLYRNAKGARADQTVSCYRDRVLDSREYIAAARKLGWRGSVIKACMDRSPRRKS